MSFKKAFFDSSVCLGKCCRYHEKGVELVELDAVMRHCGVEKALVWHVSQFDDHPNAGNAALAREIADDKRLLGVWTILPPSAGEMNFKTLFKDMKKARAVALRAFPFAHRFQMDRTAWGSFMDEVSERKIPLVLSPGIGFDWPSLGKFLSEYPKIRCLIQNCDIWGTSRQWWPLLAKYPNATIHSCTPSLEAGGLETAVEKFGAERIVFGSGFPEKYIEGAALQLASARIKDSEKELIAKGNLEKILKDSEI